MEQIKQEHSGESSIIQMIADDLQQSVQEQWQEVFQSKLEEFQQIYATSGDPAYGAYCQALFRPLVEQLRQRGISCDPRLPGGFTQSIERWGPPQERERRFWSVLRQEDGKPLGTIITRFFHDHTQLRLP